MTRIDILRQNHRQEALRRGVNPRDVDVLLADLTGRTMAWVVAHGDDSVDAARLEQMLARRYKGEPLQYIRGKTEFYSREFLVDDRVLIPRPETELLVEAVIGRADRGARIVDIGTGSGCIAISIERERPDLRVTGVDTSTGALALAARNRERLQSRISLAGSDVLTSIRGELDLIVSNPPYIPDHEVSTLSIDVRDYEPRLALTPGTRGTEVIERILDDARRVLRPGGQVMMEIGFGQEKALREIASAKRYEVEHFIPDLAGIARIIVLSAHE